jgi:hypothetical protein
MSDTRVGLTVREVECESDDGTEFSSQRVYLRLPEDLLHVVQALDDICEGIAYRDTLFRLSALYLTDRAARANTLTDIGGLVRDFVVPCAEITSRPGDKNHPRRCGTQDPPHPGFCAVCEHKVRAFKKLSTAELTLQGAEELDRKVQFIYNRCKGPNLRYPISLITAVYEDFKLVNELENGEVRVFEADDEV